MSPTRAVAVTLLVVAVCLAGSAAFVYSQIVSGGSVARGALPPSLEVSVAQWLLHRSVPTVAKASTNPLSKAPDSSDVAAGRELYRSKCEICHGYDGSGRTEVGAGQYPAPPDLRAASVQSLSDGELFYHVRHGIRHTGMPGWGMPDRHIWRLTAYLRHLPKVAPSVPPPASAGPAALPEDSTARHVGSAACRSCHQEIYDRWRKTRMANVVLDPKVHPEAIIPDMSKSDPVVTFAVSDISFVYGSKWKQRYFKKIGDD